MDFIESCRKFISIESTPTHGSKDIAELAAEFCREKGLHVEVQTEFSGDTPEANIIARIDAERPSAAEFMLQTHLDTVDPGPFQMWTKTGHNPFDATIIDGNIYGLGTADVKLDFLCKLEAIASFKGKQNWKMSPVLVGTYGEESGMTGALKLIRKNKVFAKMAMIGEPSNMQLINAAKGFASVEIRIPFSQEEIQYRQEHNLRESTSTQSRIFHGKAAHSSTPHLGESAIAKMLEYLLLLPENVIIMEMDGGTNFNTVPSHAFLELDLSTIKNSVGVKVGNVYRAIKELEREFQDYQDSEFYPSYPTLNIGLTRTFEDHIFMSGSCRMPPIITQNVYEKWMSNLNEICLKNGVIFRITDYKKPFRSTHNSMLVRGCLDELRALGLQDQCATQPSTNEASLFSRTGIECVCFGPGIRESNAHTPTEHVSIEDLKRAIEFYKNVIQRFCL